MSFLEIRDLAFSYGHKPIFHDLNLRVEKGSVFCLVGPNGCGKTTLEHCLLGFLSPASGSILVDGQVLSSYRRRELAAKMAYVPQNHSRTFPYRTLDVVVMGALRRRGMLGGDSKADEKLARQVMEELEIGHLAEVEYTTLSGGELQMVLVARALCQESNMIVLDEPTAHLDIKKSQIILQYISQFSLQQGKTILLSTHDFNQPFYFQDMGNQVQMALMNHGVLSRSAAPGDLLTAELLEETYQVKSRIFEMDADGRKRHYLAVWD